MPDVFRRLYNPKLSISMRNHASRRWRRAQRWPAWGLHGRRPLQSVAAMRLVRQRSHKARALPLRVVELGAEGGGPVFAPAAAGSGTADPTGEPPQWQAQRGAPPPPQPAPPAAVRQEEIRRRLEQEIVAAQHGQGVRGLMLLRGRCVNPGRNGVRGLFL